MSWEKGVPARGNLSENGTRNRHGYPLRKIIILGRDGKDLITRWKQKWLSQG